MPKGKASNMSKPKKQVTRDPSMSVKSEARSLPDTGSGDMARSPGTEDQRIGEAFPGVGSEMRSHAGGNYDGYSANA